MLALLQDTWKLILPQLRSQAGESTFASWLQDLRPLALERGICYLEAPNRLTCERVQKLFAPLLEDCLSKEIGTRVAVQIAPKPASLLPDELEFGPQQPVVDETNSTVFLVLQALLEERDLPARMFFFHGPAGCGKSFLLRWWRDACRPRPIMYDGVKLCDMFKVAIRERRTAGLIEELSVDRPLILDGLHRLANHTRVQKELLKVLRQRESCKSPTLLGSRFHPKKIWGMDPGLVSHLCSGFVAELALPGHGARLQYLRALEGAASRNGRAQDVESVARKVRGSFLDLQQAWAMHKHGLANRKHTGYLQLIDPRRVFQRVCTAVAEKLQVEEADLIGKGQTRSLSLARQILCHICVQEGLSQAEVGRYLGGRSRASISYCIKTLEKRMAQSGDIRRQVGELL